MNKQELAEIFILNNCKLERAKIEDLLTDFLNSELAQRRPKIDLLGAGIIEPEKVLKFLEDWDKFKPYNQQ